MNVKNIREEQRIRKHRNRILNEIEERTEFEKKIIQECLEDGMDYDEILAWLDEI